MYQALHISTYSISMTTLEEVFMALGEQAERDAANSGRAHSENTDFREVDPENPNAGEVREANERRSAKAMMRLRLRLATANRSAIYSVLVLPAFLNLLAVFLQGAGSQETFTMAIYPPMAFGISIIAFTLQLVREKEVKSKHVALAQGLTVRSFWLGTIMAHYLVNVLSSLILVSAIWWKGGEKLSGSGFPLIFLEALIYPVSLLLMAYNLSMLFTQVEFAVKVLPLTNILLGTVPTFSIYTLLQTPTFEDGAQIAHTVMSVTNPVYGLPGVIVMMMSQEPMSLMGYLTSSTAIPFYGSIILCVLLTSNLIYQDARSRTAIPGNYQAAGQAKRQTRQNLLQSMCRLLMMIAKMMTSWLKNIVWNRACSSHPIRMPQSTTAYFTLTGHRCGDAHSMPGPWWVWVFALLSVASAVLNCTVETHDPVATPCCVAQDAWDHLVAGGGCGGSGPTEAQCSAAMELCLDCQAAVEYYAHNATALKASDITVDISSAKIKCALPEWNGACTGTVKGLGVGLLILTGVALLVVATAACIAFDWRLLPSLVAWQRRKLLVEAIATQDAEARTDRGSESASPSAPLPPKPVPPAPPTPTARPPAQGFDKQPDTLRIAADAPEAESLAASPTSPASLPPNEAAVPSSAGEALALGRAQPELPPTLASQRRPRHYASAYALHTAFITIAVIAVVLRIAYVVARGLLVVGLQLAHTCLPELLLCILPLAWVSCTSRRPKSSTTAVPMSVAYWGPWQAIPRFTTYAVCTICTEIYSTLVAALAVARLPCNASPIAGVLLYCVGLLVAVVRAYCAVLALRLQDELASVCRRARPIRPSRGEATNPPLEAAWDAPHRQGQLDERARAARAAKISKARMTSLFGWMGDRDVIEDTVRDFNEPDDPAKAALACPFLPAFVCPVLRRRLVGRRILAGRHDSYPKRPARLARGKLRLDIPFNAALDLLRGNDGGVFAPQEAISSERFGRRGVNWSLDQLDLDDLDSLKLDNILDAESPLSPKRSSEGLKKKLERDDPRVLKKSISKRALDIPDVTAEEVENLKSPSGKPTVASEVMEALRLAVGNKEVGYVNHSKVQLLDSR
eukprot:symbB.v1.2.013320.t1/scaffold938.1/size150240/13